MLLARLLLFLWRKMRAVISPSLPNAGATRTSAPSNFLYLTWKELKRDGRSVSDVIAQDYAEYGHVSTTDCKFFFARRGWPLVVARIGDWFQRWLVQIADERKEQGHYTFYILTPRHIVTIPLARRKPDVWKYR